MRTWLPVLALLAGCGLLSTNPTVSGVDLLTVDAPAQLPPGTVRITGLTMHDWAYPQPDRTAALPGTAAFAPYTATDAEGGSTWHGVLFRLQPDHDYDSPGRNHPGPLLIAFLPYSDEATARRLKGLYRSRDTVSITATPVGILPADVWDTPVQNAYDTMPAFTLDRLH